QAGVSAALYPLSAARAMAAAAQNVYRAILEEGSAQTMLDAMQPRTELYEVLQYHAYEAKYDELFANRT
ncbi:MAG: methylisocitrate lyase, partial [Advenella sp.]